MTYNMSHGECHMAYYISHFIWHVTCHLLLLTVIIHYVYDVTVTCYVEHLVHNMSHGV